MIDLFKRATILTWGVMLVTTAIFCAVITAPFAVAYFLWEDWHEDKEDDEEMYNCR